MPLIQPCTRQIPFSVNAFMWKSLGSSDFTKEDQDLTLFSLSTPQLPQTWTFPIPILSIKYIILGRETCVIYIFMTIFVIGTESFNNLCFSPPGIVSFSSHLFGFVCFESQTLHQFSKSLNSLIHIINPIYFIILQSLY